MTLEEMKAQQTQLIVQRSQMKDGIEGIERQLQALGFAIGVLENEQARVAGLQPGDVDASPEEVVSE